MAVGGDPRRVRVLRRAAVDAVEEGVDHHVAAIEAELEQEALQPVARLPDEDPPGDGLVLGGVLPDDEHARRRVEAPAVEHGAPFEAEAVGRIGDGAGVAGDERAEGLLAVAGIEGGGHRAVLHGDADAVNAGPPRRGAPRRARRAASVERHQLLDVRPGRHGRDLRDGQRLHGGRRSREAHVLPALGARCGQRHRRSRRPRPPRRCRPSCPGTRCGRRRAASAAGRCPGRGPGSSHRDTASPGRRSSPRPAA